MRLYTLNGVLLCCLSASIASLCSIFTRGFLALKSGWEIFAVFRCSVLLDVLLAVLGSLVWANMSAFSLTRLSKCSASGADQVRCLLVRVYLLSGSSFVDVFFPCTYIVPALPSFLPLFFFFFYKQNVFAWCSSNTRR